MILAGKLRESVDIKNYATSTVDAWGGQTKGATTTDTVWASVEIETSSVSSEGETMLERQKAKFKMRFDTSITFNSKTQLVWDSRTWSVIGKADPTGLKAEMNILAETMPS